MNTDTKNPIIKFLDNAISLLTSPSNKKSDTDLKASAYKPFDSAKRYNEIMVGEIKPEQPFTSHGKRIKP